MVYRQKENRKKKFPSLSKNISVTETKFYAITIDDYDVSLKALLVWVFQNK